MNPGDKVVIELQAMPGWSNVPERRLALLLKAALRAYGFRCVDYRPAGPATPAPIADGAGGTTK